MLPARAMHLLLPWAVLMGCSSGPREFQLFDPGQPDDVQKVALARAERAYRLGDQDFAAQRDALAGDPVTACWLTRMLVRDVLFARERRDVGQDQVLRAAAGIGEPVEVRARAQIDALGQAAVPCLIQDLLRNPLGDRRQLGVELIGRVGAEALPFVRPMLRDGDDRTRRMAVRAVAAMSKGPEMLALLHQSSADADFGVRAEALRGLADGDAEDLGRLLRAVRQDPDPFARRAAAEALGTFADAVAAEALIVFLETCKRDRDPTGEQAAQSALQTLSATTGPRTVDAWRLWLARWKASAGR